MGPKRGGRRVWLYSPGQSLRKTQKVGDNGRKLAFALGFAVTNGVGDRLVTGPRLVTKPPSSNRLVCALGVPPNADTNPPSSGDGS